MLANGQAAGAYYLAGYAVECALKACLCKQRQPEHFPPKVSVVSRMYSHDLPGLLDLAELGTALDAENDAMPKRYWAVAKDWSEESRYAFPGQADAQLLVTAVTDPIHVRYMECCYGCAGTGRAGYRGGARLLAKLEQEQLPIVAAFWRYPTSESNWRFVIASPLVDADGSLPVYERIQAALQQLPGVHISLREIFAVGEHEPIVRHLRQSMLATTVPDQVDATVALPNYAPYSPSLAEDEVAVRVFVYRLIIQYSWLASWASAALHWRYTGEVGQWRRSSSGRTTIRRSSDCLARPTTASLRSCFPGRGGSGRSRRN